MMQPIKGHKLDSFSLDRLHRVSDLIYFEGPVLSHYVGEDNSNYLVHWVDSDTVCNRWIMYEIPLHIIHSYINQQLSLRDVFIKNSKNIITVFDLDDDLNYKESFITEKNYLPDSYLPSIDSYYVFKPKVYEDLESYYMSVSDTGLLQAIFKNNNRIGYGTVPLEFFSPVMHHLNEINRSLSESYYKEKNDNRPFLSGNKKVPKLEKATIIPQTQYQISGSGIGSFKLFMQPMVGQKALYGEKTESDNFFDFLNKFFLSGFNYDELKSIINHVSSDAVVHFEKLLRNIEVNKFDFLLKWNNNLSNTSNQILLSFNEVGKALENINKLEFENSEEIKFTGRFVELNLLTKHYTFIQDDGLEKKESRGNFSTQIADAIMLVQFNKSYDITVLRNESKEVGHKKTKLKDTLISFVPISE